MSTGVIIVGVILLLLTLLMLRVPVAISLGAAGALGLLVLHNFEYATNVMGSDPFSQTARVSLTIVPMFILMGMFAVRAQVAEYVFKIANRVLGRFPGGLGIATVAASAGFSAVSGSSIGTAATMARLSVNEMRQAGYPTSLATALVAVAGTLGSMIPPSTILVLYAILAQVSIAQMLAAGILPGILSALAYALYLMYAGARLKRKGLLKANNISDAMVEARQNLANKRTRTKAATASRNRTTESRSRPNNNETTPGKGGTRDEDQIPLRELPWRGLVYVLVLFIIVLGGMYSGLFTATESAAFGALSALLILLIELRKSGLKAIWAGVLDALRDAASTTAMVFFIVIGSGILTAFFVAARVPQMLTDAVTSWDLSPPLVLGLLLLALVPLGMVLDSLSLLVISVPLVLPIAVEFGFDAIWLGVMIVKFIEIGMVTPPVGINAFVVAGTTGLRSETVFRGIIPFFFIDLILIAVLFFWHDLVLLLPSLVVEGG